MVKISLFSKLESESSAELNVARQIALTADQTESGVGHAELKPVAEINPVEGVNCLDSDLQFHSFVDAEVFRQSDIEFLKRLIAEFIQRIWQNAQRILAADNVVVSEAGETARVERRNINAVASALLVALTDAIF